MQHAKTTDTGADREIMGIWLRVVLQRMTYFPQNRTFRHSARMIDKNLRKELKRMK